MSSHVGCAKPVCIVTVESSANFTCNTYVSELLRLASALSRFIGCTRHVPQRVGTRLLKGLLAQEMSWVALAWVDDREV